MKKKAGLLLSLTLAASTVLGACGNSDKASSDKKDTKDNKDFKVGLVTDVGGVDDKSFNQSSWEGLQKFGKDNGLKEKTNYRYLQSEKEADYIPNLKKILKR